MYKRQVFDDNEHAYIVDLSSDGSSYRVLKYGKDGGSGAAFETTIIDNRPIDWSEGAARPRLAARNGFLYVTDPAAGQVLRVKLATLQQDTLIDSPELLAGGPAFVEFGEEAYTLTDNGGTPFVSFGGTSGLSATILPNGKLHVAASGSVEGPIEVTVTAFDGSWADTEFRGRSDAMTFDLVVADTVVSGTKFLDENANGVRNAGEPGLNNWTIFLDQNLNGTLDSGETATTTDHNGDYLIRTLEPGVNFVSEVVGEDMIQVSPSATLSDIPVFCTDYSGGTLAVDSEDGFTIDNTATGDGDDVQWHVSSNRHADSAGFSMYFGNDSRSSFSSSERVAGTITSPDIKLTGATSATLSFNSFLDVDTSTDIANAKVVYTVDDVEKTDTIALSLIHI